MSALSIIAGLWFTATLPIPATIPVGHWSGTGQVVQSQTGEATLRFSLNVLADGSVTGSIGNAAIRSGRVYLNSGRLVAARGYRIRAFLTGPVSTNDNPSHNHFTLFVSLRGGVLTGFGISEGPGGTPGLHVTSVVLHRVEEDDLDLVSTALDMKEAYFQ